MKRKEINTLLFQFLRTSYLFEKSEEKKFDLSWQEVYLLQLLRKNGAMKISDIGNELLLEKYQASRLINALREKKVIQKAQDLDDRRVYYISISQKGKLSLEKIEEYHYTLLTRNENMIPDKDLLVLQKAVQSFAALVGLPA